jgi:hypothetical protein
MADAALQVFDTGMALATGKAPLSLLPLALGALDVWAGKALLRSARTQDIEALHLRDG